MALSNPGGDGGDGGLTTIERTPTMHDAIEVAPSWPSSLPQPVAEETGLAGTGLRRALVGLDLIALVAGTILGFRLSSAPAPGSLPGHTALLIVAVVAVGYWSIRSRSLYLARVAGVRSIELERLLRACVTTGVAWAAIEAATADDLQARRVVLGTVITFALLVVLRGGFRAWLVARRANGDLSRPVVIIGTNDNARYLLDLVGQQPELGFRAVGVVGDHQEAQRNGLGDVWLGDESTAQMLLREDKITGAFVAAGAVPTSILGPLVRSLTALGGHIHLSPGVRGIGQQRLLPVHLSYEPLYYVEHAQLQRHQLAFKRAIDIVLSTILLIVSAPVVLGAAIWIKAHDRGPMFFRQERVGRNGQTFTIVKLRTMRINAEEEMDELREQNERNGPLFKMDDDPRVTGPGRILRGLSIDELPQLINVLRGDMSLVGPRPALPSETETFDERMRERTTVPPGITGLWQVEARDNPAFGAYERLDLFYVENWSAYLDLCILLNTVESEVARLLRRAWQRRGADDASAATDLDGPDGTRLSLDTSV